MKHVENQDQSKAVPMATAFTSQQGVSSFSGLMPAKRLKELFVKQPQGQQTGQDQQEGSSSEACLNNSSSTNTPADPSLGRTSSSINAPVTPVSSSSWFRHPFSSSNGSTRLASGVLQASQLHAGGANTPILQQQHSSSTPSQPQHSHLLRSTSSSGRKQQPPACEPSLATRLSRNMATAARVLQRRETCPEDVQHLLHTQTSSNSSSTGSAHQPRLSRRLLGSSHSCPAPSNAAPSAAPAAAAAPALHQHSPSTGSSSMAAVSAPETPTLLSSGGHNPSAHAQGSSQPAHSRLLRMRSASLTELTSSNRYRQAAWEPARAAALSKRMAHAARIVPRKPTCPQGTQLRRAQASSNSGSRSSSSAGSLGLAHVLRSSQSCPPPSGTVPSFAAPAGQQPNSGTENPCAGMPVGSVCQQQPNLLSTPATPAAHTTLGPFGAAVPAARQHVPSGCSEITACGDDSSSESSDSTTPQPDPAATAAVPYPECLFDPAVAARLSNSFTTQVYSSNTGQQVAVARSGSIILAVFVKEATGEIWEADEDQITFPDGNRGSSSKAHAAGVGMVYARAAADTMPLSAGAAARAYITLNRSSSSGGSSSSGSWSLRRALGSCVSSRSTGRSSTSSNSRSSSSLRRALGSFVSSGSSKSNISTVSMCRSDSSRGLLGGSSSKGSMSSHSYPNRGSSRRSTCAGKAQPAFSVLAAAKARLTEWRQARKAQQQAQAAAYWQELDEAAHLAVRLAGCQSFVLPRNWPQGARQQVQEQRRLRVLLATYSRE